MILLVAALLVWVMFFTWVFFTTVERGDRSVDLWFTTVVVHASITTIVVIASGVFALMDIWDKYKPQPCDSYASKESMNDSTQS